MFHLHRTRRTVIVTLNLSLLFKKRSACIFARMRTAPALLIAFMCLSLLTLQLSGLHLHVSTDGQGGALHGMHLHDADPDGHGHDHDADVHVSPFESAATWQNLVILLVTFVFTLLASIWANETVWPSFVERLTARCRSRWRPPLRAPPQHSS